MTSMREQGNVHLNKGEYEQAIAKYTDGIEQNENDLHFLYSNRSFARWKLGNLDMALEDANKCIELKPLWSKGYGRKGVALFSLGRYQEALEVYDEGVTLDHSNQSLLDGQKQCREKLTNEQLDLQTNELNRENGNHTSTNEAKQRASEEKQTFSDSSNPMDDFMADIKALDNSQDNTDPMASFLSEIKSLDKVQTVDKQFVVDHDDEMSGWTSENQIARILQNNYKWINVNPFTVLGITNEDATMDDITHRYRKLSTMVHPDKCRAVNAEDAFNEVKMAYERLQDESARKLIVTIIKQCKDRVITARERLAKKGVSEAQINERNGTLVEAMEKEIKREFATREHKRQKADIVRRENEKRERQREEDELEHWRTVKEYEEGVRETREERAKGWQGFAGKKKKILETKSNVAPEMCDSRSREMKKRKLMGIDKDYAANWR